MQMKRIMSANRAGGLLAAAVGVLSLMEASRLYPLREGVWVGDHTIPALMGGVLLVLGVIIARGSRKQAAVPASPQPPTDSAPSAERRQLVGCFVLLLCYGVLISQLGYVISTFISGMLLFKMFGKYRWPACALNSAMVTAVIQLLFVEWLQVSFPNGIFGF
ncbi:tripartite tricarboxylate transporter TctB family protein [Paenibacillus xerothermodurans]|uniref:Tripartite tricarboxylate transporter TctB family protein n=1 Tax=Paenibacillus xerothermodurans TaxID=1977292 RepID=A0A2W1N8N0_PAEXE|nr:tripartite tricarboxylate transporter TctB family protein [Paenibacillus xerothermodurans]PZE20737.1 tripartite tricarboxylate transporter TctB family protein [Paenibacillus xerothermodurans]